VAAMRSAKASMSLINRPNGQSRGRVCAGARARRPPLRSGSPPVLGLAARGETRSAHFVRCARTIAASQNTKRALRARGHEPCAPRRRAMSLPAHTRPRLCRHRRGMRRRTLRALQRGGRCPVGATCGAASIAAARSARAQRVLPLLTRGDCPSATTAGSEASFAARARCEKHSGVGPQGRPRQ